MLLVKQMAWADNDTTIMIHNRITTRFEMSPVARGKPSQTTRWKEYGKKGQLIPPLRRKTAKLLRCYTLHTDTAII